MNENYEDYSEKLVEMVRTNEEALGLTKKYFRNIILSALIIIVPSFLHLAYANNIMATIFVSILLIGFVLIISRSNTSSSEITEDEIMSHIRYLSHENREGRLPGTRGSKDVIAYLIKNLKSYGVRPAFGKSYTQPFNIQTGIQLGPLNNIIINKDTLVVQTDYLPLFFSANGNFSGEVVFAGYGFQINEKEFVWIELKSHFDLETWSCVWF